MNRLARAADARTDAKTAGRSRAETRIRSRKSAVARFDHGGRPTSAPSSRRACRRSLPVRPFAARGRPIRRSATSRDSPRTTGTSPIRPRCRGSARCRRATTSRSWWRRFSATSEKPADADAAAGKPAGRKHPSIASEIAAPASQADARIARRRSENPARQRFRRASQQVAQSDFVQRDNNIASHNSSSDDETEEPKNRRQHGGALPQ